MPGKRILVIDDNVINLRVAQLTLQLGGFDVRTVPDAASALGLVADWAPGAILVDLRMPGMDGVAFIGALRALPGMQAVPAVAMSAYDPPSRARVAELGFSGFIGKPMAPSDFCRQLNGFIGAAS